MSTPWLGWAPVDATPVGGQQCELIRQLARQLRDVRGVGDETPLLVREDDLSFIVSIVDVHDREIEFDFMRWFSLEERQARELVAKLRHADDVAEQFLVGD